MRYIYRHLDIPDDTELLVRIDSAAGKLCGALGRLDVGSVGLSEYGRSYLQRHIAGMRSTLERNAQILALSISGYRGDLDDFVFLDYGGGIGILSLLAKSAGIGHVIHNDIYDVSSNDARILGNALYLSAERYFCGDIGETLDFIANANDRGHAIASCDVIEHVYDTERLFRRLAVMPDNWDIRVVMSSDANARNPILRWRLQRKQRLIETRDRQFVYGHKQRDSLKAYLSIRREMIRAQAPELRNGEVKRLARETRGLREDDIRKAVDDHRIWKRYPDDPPHPTNTCDPHTGNWAERLMDPDILKGILEAGGFHVEIRHGYYGRSGGAFRRFIAGMINEGIHAMGREGIRIAPSYLVYGYRPGSKSPAR
jgi:hypothetical protein